MPAENEYGAMPIVEVDGRALPSAAAVLVEEVVVSDHLHLPDMLELRFRDEAQAVLVDTGIDVGKPVEVSAVPVGRGVTAKPLFKGEVTALESEYDAASGSHTVVRAYDKSHRLMQHRAVRAWLDTTLAEVVREVAGEVGITVRSAHGPVRYEYVARLDETSWEFLQRLARESGYEVSSQLGDLQLRRPPESDAAPRGGDLRGEPQSNQLVLGTNLRSLRVRLSAASQVKESTVRSWDWHAKQALIGQASAETGAVVVEDTPSALATAFGASPAISATHPLTSQEQVDEAARSLAELIAASCAEAYGVVDGNPGVRAGEAVSIANSGKKFDGKYLVTATRHVFDEEGFRTHFEITGRHERTVLGLTRSGEQPDHRFTGVVVAIVTNNRDPDGLGRVKVKFPWLSDVLESSWARLAGPDAGADGRGTLFIPEVNDEVLVAFEHGEFRRPFVIGSLWNGVDKAPTNGAVNQSGQVVTRQMRTRIGHVVRLSDDDSDKHIEIVTADGKRAIRLDESARKLVMTVANSTVTIEDSGAVTIDASADVDIKAGANLTLEATGNVTIKGAAVKVDGGGSTEIKGGVVRIN